MMKLSVDSTPIGSVGISALPVSETTRLTSGKLFRVRSMRFMTLREASRLMPGSFLGGDDDGAFRELGQELAPEPGREPATAGEQAERHQDGDPRAALGQPQYGGVGAARPMDEPRLAFARSRARPARWRRAPASGSWSGRGTRQGQG